MATSQGQYFNVPLSCSVGSIPYENIASSPSATAGGNGGMRSLSLDKPHFPKRRNSKASSVVTEPEEPQQPWYQQYINSVIYGIINTIACLPVLYGYASIVFGNELYQPFLPQLSKLMILSSVLHQFIFSVGSSLPYAVGQVQDAGLIFLAHIATSVVNLLEDKHPPEVVVATALAVLGTCTALLGATLIFLGRAKLARLVSYLPLPVIGGQIVFIAAFCFRAGVALSVGRDLDTIAAWASLYDEHNAILVIPGVLAGLVMCIVPRKVHHFLALPLTMLAVPALFYLTLLLGHNSMDNAREFGWLGPAGEPASWQSSLALYGIPDLFSKVEWWVLIYQLPTWLGMCFVVAFSSCLDIVAIEMDGGTPLNKNHELTTVGVSNLIAGLAGGFTGSYIFSQTIFTYRTKTTSRLCGWVLIAAEFAVFVVNIDLMSFIPLFFFAATLHFITAELMLEWLWEARRRMTSKEYMVLWATFLGNTFLGIIPGFALGIVLSMAMFIISFAKATARTTQANIQRSRVIRLKQHRRFLDQGGRILTLELSGAIFFGSSVQTLEHIKSLLGVPTASPPTRSRSSRKLSRTVSNSSKFTAAKREESPPPSFFSRLAGRLFGRSSSTPERRKDEKVSLLPLTTAATGGEKGSKEEQAALMGAATAISSSATLSNDLYGATTAASQNSKKKKRDGASDHPRFLILDMRRVTAIDMTSVVNCFLPLQNLCRELRVTLVYCNCNMRVEFHIRSNRLVDDTGKNTHLFPTLHQALDYCETECLQEEVIHSHGNSIRSRAFSLRTAHHLTVVQVLKIMLAIESDGDDDLSASPRSPHVLHEGIAGTIIEGLTEEDLETIAEYSKEEEYKSGQTIFYADEPADSFFLVLMGEVALESLANHKGSVDDALSVSFEPDRPMLSSGGGSHYESEDEHMLDVHPKGVGRRRFREEDENRRVEVVLHTGSLFGFVDFYLEQRRRFFARATSDVRLGVFSEQALKRLERDNPRLLLLVQRILLKQFAIELGNLAAL